MKTTSFIASMLILVSLFTLLTACDQEPFVTIVNPDIPAVPDVSEVTDTVNSVEVIISDMANAHESKPYGVPSSWDWYSRPAIHHYLPLSDYHAYTCYGQFYEDIFETKATNTRVEMRNLRTWYLSKSKHTWIPLQNKRPIIEGLWFPEDHSAAGIPADVRKEENGGISATAGYGLSEGKCFHFWIKDRAAIDRTDIDGILVTMEARLIVADPTKPNDMHLARYILNVGADYWTSVEGGTNAQGDIGMGRFKFVIPAWRHYNFTTVPAEILRQNPPPL
jgi:hypothetical protein